MCAIPRYLQSFLFVALVIQSPARSACRDCVSPPPGGPAANPFAAYDTPCDTAACRAPGIPRVSVSLADLSLSVRVTDISLAGGEPELVLERVWEQDGAPGPFGNRWSFNLDETLTVSGNSGYTLRRGCGRIDRFAQATGTSAFFAVTGAPDTLVRNGDGSFTVNSPAGAVRQYNAAGKLVSIRERGVVAATFDYDGAGRLASARSRGRTLEFHYDDSGRVTSVSDPAGRSVAYSYSGGNLTRQTNPDGSTVAYTYDDAGLLTAIARGDAVTSVAYNVDGTHSSVASVTLPGGAVRTYDTPRSSREIRVTRGARQTWYIPNALGLLESVTDSAGNRATFVYDAAGRPTRLIDAAGRTTRIEYDSGGKPTAIVDAAGNRWSAAWANGRVQRITEPGGNAWTLGYEGSALSAVAPPAGAHAYAEIDPNGAVTSLHLYGVTTAYEYNGDGLVTRYTDPRGNAARYEYDGAGRVTARTDAAGNTIRAEYGSGLRPTAYIAGDTRISAAPSGLVRDALGRLVRYTDSFGNQIAYAWTEAGRLARIELPGNRGVTYEYDSAGRLARVSDTAGNFAIYRYDAAGYPVSLNVSGGPVTIYQYDDARNLRAIVSTGPDGAPVAGYRYTLDANGNRTAINALEPYSGSFRFPPLSREAAQGFRYNPSGLLTAIEGSGLTFSYDPFGRLQSVAGDAPASYAYDASGLRISRTSRGETRRFLYDLSGERPRLIMELDPDNNVTAWYVWGLAPLWRVAAGGRTDFYHFDGSGNVVAVSNPASGVANRYRYDALGRLVASEESVSNPFRSRGAAGVVDDGNGILYADGRYLLPEFRATLPGTIDLGPPPPASASSAESPTALSPPPPPGGSNEASVAQAPACASDRCPPNPSGAGWQPAADWQSAS